jgi:hypothetical protein
MVNAVVPGSGEISSTSHESNRDAPGQAYLAGTLLILYNKEQVQFFRFHLVLFLLFLNTLRNSLASPINFKANSRRDNDNCIRDYGFFFSKFADDFLAVYFYFAGRNKCHKD